MHLGKHKTESGETLGFGRRKGLDRWRRRGQGVRHASNRKEGDVWFEQDRNCGETGKTPMPEYFYEKRAIKWFGMDRKCGKHGRTIIGRWQQGKTTLTDYFYDEDKPPD